jgi:hypothetical protein
MLVVLNPFTMITFAVLVLLLTGDGSNIESLLGSLKQEEQQDADDVNLGVAKTLQVMPLSELPPSEQRWLTVGSLRIL